MLKKIQIIALYSAFILCFNTYSLAAPNYSDVPSTHWAYSSIVKMADMGIIVGDSSGKYNPDQPLDKFTTSKMLAKVAGYKYINISESESQYYERAYKANEYTLSLYRNAFTRWDSTAEREIAFLLEKEILAVEDLNQFVVKMTDGTERLRGLTREDISVLLVKVMGKQNEALSTTYSSKFADDTTISESARPYVNYLRQIGIVTGGTDNKFNPKSAVTKAAIAVMLDKTITAMNNTTNNSTNSTQTSGTQASNIESISGKIDKIYPSLYAIQIEGTDGKKNIWKLSQTAGIYVDGLVKTLSDLKEGMSITGVINNTDIVEIRAQALTTGAIIDTPTNQQISTLEGIVSFISSDTTTKTIGVEIKVLNLNGDINTVVSSYVLSADCKITRGSLAEQFTNIKRGDIIKGQVSGNKILSIRLEEKDLKLKGTLLEKRYAETTGTAYLKIEDALGEKYDLKVTSMTSVSRKSKGSISYNELRIGDSVELTAEYDQIIELYAEGTKSTKEGIVEEIHITKQGSQIALRDLNTSTIVTYEIIPDAADVYMLRIGNKIKIWLDSLEIEDISIIDANSLTSSYTGYIQSIKSSYITVSETSSSSSASKQISYDKDTIFIDGVTGGTIRAEYLEREMQVFITLSNSKSTYAKIITVLRYVD